LERSTVLRLLAPADRSISIWDKQGDFHGFGDVKLLLFLTWGNVSEVTVGVGITFLLKNMALCEDKLDDQGSQAF
jgi:hypothetical protein